MTEMWARVKSSKIRPRPFSDGLKANRGQALVEYVLILIITVSIVIALMNFMFKPFGEFISKYMGQYTACLLEYGELPTLGGETPTAVDEDGECDARFEAATLSAGRPPRPGEGNASTKPPASSSKSENDGKSQSQRQAANRSAGSAGRNSRMGQRSTGAETAAGRPAGKTVEISLSSGPGGQYFTPNSRENVLKRPDKTTYVAITGLSASERKQLDKRNEGRGKPVAVGEGYAPPIKKMAVKKPPERSVASTEEGAGFTIGNFIRFLFIAALVIALVIFIGGQVLQMSKSREK